MIALLSPEGLSPPIRTASLPMRMSVCQHLRWPDTVPKMTERLGAPLLNCTVCDIYSAIRLWVCVSDTHAFLDCFFRILSGSTVPHCAQVLLSLQLPAQLGGRLGRLGHFCCGDEQLCTCHHWGRFPAIASTDEAPSLPTLNITTALPGALLFILTVCLRQYYC
ncbi:Hypothetical predicted protein [Marmota monax]|uniref:Uncharacterized protein n=1 Tax=Marmota monax TaxID=9995 RepID=A0A5E4A3K7_MARMO|nr:hypothetical protein GHT09_001696 [Marmota monax]VTJ51664.1 Hypothetical predicted protein [Marmota monax]